MTSSLDMINHQTNWIHKVSNIRRNILKLSRFPRNLKWLLHDCKGKISSTKGDKIEEVIGCYFCWTRNPREKQTEQTYGKEKAWFCNGTAPHWGFFQSQNIVGKICGKGIGVKMITHKQQKPKCYKMIFFCHLGGQIQKSFRIQNLHFNKLCFNKVIIKALNQ